MLTIFEEDEDEPYHTGLFWPDGSPIIACPEPRKLGYIGFVDPEYLEEVRIAHQQKKRKRKRNAGTRKSKA